MLESTVDILKQIVEELKGINGHLNSIDDALIVISSEAPKANEWRELTVDAIRGLGRK